MLEDANLSKIITWSEEGDAVMIWSEENLGRILPRYGFKTNNFSAIQRQLNYYGFRKTTQGKNPTVYMHEHFYRGSPYLNEIKKRTAIKAADVATKEVSENTRMSSRRVTRSSTAKSSSWPSSPSLNESIVLDPLPLEQSFEQSSLPFALPQESLEIQRLSEENRMLKEEMMRLREQQEQTQLLMREMFAQLQQNKQETNDLKIFINSLAQPPQTPQMIEDPAATQILEEIFSQTQDLNNQDLNTQELNTQDWNLDEIRFDEIAIQN